MADHILTPALFPFLVVMYVRLARTEERDAVETFGDLYRQHAAVTPAWIPKLGSRQVGSPGKRAER
jgi:protein-S-isoprenylcysteine O-methyltransferase Ste14